MTRRFGGRGHARGGSIYATGNNMVRPIDEDLSFKPDPGRTLVRNGVALNPAGARLQRQNNQSKKK